MKLTDYSFEVTKFGCDKDTFFNNKGVSTKISIIQELDGQPSIGTSENTADVIILIKWFHKGLIGAKKVLDYDAVDGYLADTIKDYNSIESQNKIREVIKSSHQKISETFEELKTKTNINTDIKFVELDDYAVQRLLESISRKLSKLK